LDKQSNLNKLIWEIKIIGNIAQGNKKIKIINKISINKPYIRILLNKNWGRSIKLKGIRNRNIKIKIKIEIEIEIETEIKSKKIAH
jgi:hypothetical protein